MIVRCFLKKTTAFALFFTFALLPVFSQSEDAEGEDGGGENEETLPSIESRWQGGTFETFAKGDVTLSFNLGVVFPTVFTVGSAAQYDPPVGGTGTISANYFLTSHIFVGGSLQGFFISTIGENMFYTVGMGPHIGYEWSVWRFEFPVSLTVGWAWESYLEHLYFGFLAKTQAAVYFRTFNDWSFGLEISWWFLPQWGTKSKNAHENEVRGNDAIGNFLGLTLTAQYHF